VTMVDRLLGSCTYRSSCWHAQDSRTPLRPFDETILSRAKFFLSRMRMDT
jgi:hypothetical protein